MPAISKEGNRSARGRHVINFTAARGQSFVEEAEESTRAREGCIAREMHILRRKGHVKGFRSSREAVVIGTGKGKEVKVPENRMGKGSTGSVNL